jgi:hypothetical protein
LLAKWILCEQNLPKEVETTRSLVGYEEEIEAVDQHAFGDASGKGVSSVVYAVTEQQSGINQGIVASKSTVVNQRERVA